MDSKSSLPEEKEILNAIFEHASEGIIVSNANGKIIMANPVAGKQFGYDVSQFLKMNIDDLVPNRFSKHSEHRKSYSKNPHPRSMGIGLDLHALRYDGSEFPVEISLSSFKTNNELFIVCFIIDISFRKKKEEELEIAHKEIKKLYSETENKVAERTNELAQAVTELAESKQELISALEREKDLNKLKSSFITTASHEFRTPLTAILSSISLISKYRTEEQDEKRQKHISKIKSAVGNLIEILNDFLSLSKLEEGVIRNEPVNVELKEFCNELIEEIGPMTKKGQGIKYEHSGKASISVDKQLLRNVLLNLLSNAIKYSFENKTIFLRTKINKKDFTLEITDQGIGIPSEDQKLLFNRFFRAKNATNIEGTGLGLNIVQKYVDLMGGEINFTSEQNVGTTFTVVVPIMK